MNRRLHIVCLDVPYPPDYGGACDMFYKIKFLSGLGIKIILHCFEYGRTRQKELERYCEQVYYYKRKVSFRWRLPYIVSSRRSNELIKRLRDDNFPILLEGIHCTYYLFNRKLEGRTVWVRMHNLESEYYADLAKDTHHFFKSIYYRIESRLLKNYEKVLLPKANLLAINELEQKKLQQWNLNHLFLLPLFVEKMKITSQPGMGKFCFFHGNLSVPENENAVIFIVQELAAKMDHKFVIAGKNPTSAVRKVCRRDNVKLIANPADSQLDQLLKDAQINIIPIFNNTGIKVKLVHSLFKGRFVLTTSSITGGGGLDELCTLARTADDFRNAVINLMNKEFPDTEILKRKNFLETYFDPEANAQKLSNLIFN